MIVCEGCLDLQAEIDKLNQEYDKIQDRFKNVKKTLIKSNNYITALKADNEKLKNETVWVHRKLGIKLDAPITDIQAEMHVMKYNADGYITYIEAHKCDDKQGKIARQSVRIAELEREIEKLSKVISGCHEGRGELEGNIHLLEQSIAELEADIGLKQLSIQAYENSINEFEQDLKLSNKVNADLISVANKRAKHIRKCNELVINLNDEIKEVKLENGQDGWLYDDMELIFQSYYNIRMLLSGHKPDKLPTMNPADIEIMESYEEKIKKLKQDIETKTAEHDMMVFLYEESKNNLDQYEKLVGAYEHATCGTFVTRNLKLTKALKKFDQEVKN